MELVGVDLVDAEGVAGEDEELAVGGEGWEGSAGDGQFLGGGVEIEDLERDQSVVIEGDQTVPLAESTMQQSVPGRTSSGPTVQLLVCVS